MKKRIEIGPNLILLLISLTTFDENHQCHQHVYILCLIYVLLSLCIIHCTAIYINIERCFYIYINNIYITGSSDTIHFSTPHMLIIIMRNVRSLCFVMCLVHTSVKEIQIIFYTFKKKRIEKNEKFFTFSNFNESKL